MPFCFNLFKTAVCETENCRAISVEDLPSMYNLHILKISSVDSFGRAAIYLLIRS